MTVIRIPIQIKWNYKKLKSKMAIKTVKIKSKTLLMFVNADLKKKNTILIFDTIKSSE